MRMAVLDADPVQLALLVHTLTHQLAVAAGVISCAPLVAGEALQRALRNKVFDLLVPG